MSTRALRAAYWPLYRHDPTRPEVRSVLRKILRAAARFPDRLVRQQLSATTVDSFAAFSYVADRRRIDALISEAKSDLAIIVDAVECESPRSIKSVYDRAFTTYKVKRSPISRLLARHGTSDRGLAFKYNNIPHPFSAKDFPGAVPMNLARTPEQSSEIKLFREFTEFLKKNNLRTSLQGNKLRFDLPTEYTVLGKPLALSRQRNLLRKSYANLYRDSPKPVHKDVLEHIDKVLSGNQELSRKFQRRLKDCARQYYSVSEDDRLLRTNFYTKGPSGPA